MLNPKWTEEKVSKKLREINMSVPELMRKALTSEVVATPTMELVVDKALEDPNFPEEKKVKLRNLKAAGIFSKKRLSVNFDVSKKIDLYVGRKINEAIKNGELPPRNQIKNFPWLKKLTSYEK